MRIASFALLLLLTVSHTGCFEPPVSEAIEFSFDDRGRVQVRATTKIGAESSFKSAPKKQNLILEARNEARCGEDHWSRHLAYLSPVSLIRSTVYKDGELREIVRTAAFEEPRVLERLFDGFPLGVSFLRQEDRMTLEIVPLGGRRASDRERRDVEKTLIEFSDRLSQYFRVAREVNEWAGKTSSRQRSFFGRMFSRLLGKSEEDESITHEEKEIRDRLEAAMDGVLEVLVDEERNALLGDQAERVYNPFPAALTVQVSGELEEVAGFERLSDKKAGVPPFGLQGSLLKLEGRWISPDPLVAFLKADRSTEEPRFDLDAFLASPRTANAPAPEEIKEAIEAGLKPAAAFRIRWKLPRGGQ